MGRTAVAILDLDQWTANTDVVVVADDMSRTLTWLPRDLWSRRFGCKLGLVFKRGGLAQFGEALAEAGLPCDGIVCLRRGATAAALRNTVVTVPVAERLDFWYPIAPAQPIEEGRKRIAFAPPSEQLSGERLHQWIGARIDLDGRGPDLQRLQRQQVLLRALIESGFDFAAALRDPDRVQLSGLEPLAPLRTIDANWRFRTLPGIYPRSIEGKEVLTRGSLGERLYRRLRRAVGRRLAARRGGGRLKRGPAPARSEVVLAWGRHVSDAFEVKLRAICERLGIEPSVLMAIIAFETGGSFSPAARNLSTGATGLIQFMPRTAEELGTTSAALAAMSPLEQLDYVERYLRPYAGRMSSLASAYMAILWPEAVSEPPDFVLFAAPSDVYARNAGLDFDNTGRVTKLDAAMRVQQCLHDGMGPEHAC